MIVRDELAEVSMLIWSRLRRHGHSVMSPLGISLLSTAVAQLQTAADIRPADCSRVSNAADWRSGIFYPRQPWPPILVRHKLDLSCNIYISYSLHPARNCYC